MDYLEFSEMLQPYNAEAEEKEQQAIKELTSKLEDKFADRGLQFTLNFYGAMPMQAMGWLDGERFYFRFRRDTAMLKVGNVNPAVAREEHEHRKQRFPAYDGVMMTNEHPAAFPHIVSAQSSIVGVTGEPLAGFLEPDEIYKTFIRLIQAL